VRLEHLLSGSTLRRAQKTLDSEVPLSITIVRKYLQRRNQLVPSEQKRPGNSGSESGADRARGTVKGTDPAYCLLPTAYWLKGLVAQVVRALH
jgi:hypothetical protein